MIAERPRHGYELIKDIGDRFGGAYSPSPGVIYPTLAWLDDMGYAAIEAGPAGRKLYRVTPEGEAFIVANRAAVEALMSRIGQPGARGDDFPPEPVIEAMGRLKAALRRRLRGGGFDAEAIGRIVSALEAATRVVEQDQ